MSVLPYGGVILLASEILKVLVLGTNRDWDAKFGDKYVLSIDAPNLVSFDHESAENVLVNLFMNSENLLETNLDLDCFMGTFCLDWYINIIDFLSKLNCSKSISLLFSSEQVFIEAYLVQFLPPFHDSFNS